MTSTGLLDIEAYRTDDFNRNVTVECHKTHPMCFTLGCELCFYNRRCCRAVAVFTVCSRRWLPLPVVREFVKPLVVKMKPAYSALRALNSAYKDRSSVHRRAYALRVCSDFV